MTCLCEGRNGIIAVERSSDKAEKVEKSDAAPGCIDAPPPYFAYDTPALAREPEPVPVCLRHEERDVLPCLLQTSRPACAFKH